MSHFLLMTLKRRLDYNLKFSSGCRSIALLATGGSLSFQCVSFLVKCQEQCLCECDLSSSQVIAQFLYRKQSEYWLLVSAFLSYLLSSLLRTHPHILPQFIQIMAHTGSHQTTHSTTTGTGLHVTLLLPPQLFWVLKLGRVFPYFEIEFL